MKHRISPSAIIATLALFVALGGTSMAATGYRITSIWQIAPNVRHVLRGPRGPQGPAGQTGPQGSAGPAGTQQGSVGTADIAHAVPQNGYRATLTPSNPTATVAVVCPTSDPDVLTGGFVGQNEIVTTSEMTQYATQAWLVVAHLDPSASSGNVQAWVECVPSD